MIRRLLVASLFTLGLTLAAPHPRAQVGLTAGQAQLYPQVSVSNNLAIDCNGSACATTIGTSQNPTVSVSTAHANDSVIVITTALNTATITSVTAPGLTFTNRTTEAVENGANITEWCASAAAPLSSVTVTVNYNAVIASRIVALGISGGTTPCTFDAGGGIGLPVVGLQPSGTSVTATIDTSTAYCFLFASIWGGAFGTLTPPSGFSQVFLGASGYVGYEVVSSTQTNLTLVASWTTASQAVGIVADAVHQ